MPEIGARKARAASGVRGRLLFPGFPVRERASLLPRNRRKLPMSRGC
jgi:hypothetical protein